MSSALDILARRNAEIEARQSVRRAELEAFFGRHPDIKIWADDIKAELGTGVRVRSFREGRQ